MADAGPDSVWTGNTVALDGSRSQDPDGEIISFQWQLIHRDDPAHKRTAAGERPQLANVHEGFHAVTLTVTDDDGNVDVDRMELAVAKPKVVVVPMF